MPRRRRRGGQGLVEFAVVLPLFLGMVIGMVDFGRAIWAGDSLAAAAREAARFAIVHGGAASTACPVGPPGPDAVIPVAGPTCPHPSPSRQAIKDAAIQASLAGGRDLVVTVCYGTPGSNPCSGDVDSPGATNARGHTVTVVMTSHVDLAIPSLLGNRSFNVTGSSTMLVNH